MSQSMYNIKESRLRVVCRILQYVKGTPNNRILFKMMEDLIIEAYTSVDNVGSMFDGRLNSRYCIFLEGNPMTRRSKK